MLSTKCSLKDEERVMDQRYRSEINRRRTFGIISHPDAGKTTLTEKLLLFGGAIQQAGAVKAKHATRHATSDWMSIEKERGISVTTSVMKFNYKGFEINLLDTPGHQDFSEDTYRVLTAGVLPIRNETSEHVDSALNALMTEIESQLINFAPVRVISMQTQDQLMAEIRRQYESGGFDETQTATWGKQLGVRYIVSGKVFSSDERTEKARRVQYYLFIRAVSVETGEILFQNQVPITKAII